MLALAISFDQTPKGDTIETEDGTRITVRNWPQDSDTNMVAYRPTQKFGVVVSASQIAEDIARLLRAVDATTRVSRRTDWYKRLQQYALGTSSRD
jgi:hypothetical protein